MATDTDKSGLINTKSILEPTGESVERVTAGKNTQPLLEAVKDDDVYNKIIHSFYKDCD